MERAASIAAIVFAGRSPGVLMKASSAIVTTGLPVSTLPWIA